jgi:hypothetical protein
VRASSSLVNSSWLGFFVQAGAAARDRIVSATMTRMQVKKRLTE